jgi:hypothetical protein
MVRGQDGHATEGEGRTMRPSPSGTEAGGGHWPCPLPVLDRAALEELTAELGDRGAVERFLRSFVDLLPGRVAAIGAHGEPLELADKIEGIAAVAAMAGAPRLAHLVREIVAGARAGRLPCRAKVVALSHEAQVTGDELGDYLRGLEAAC